MCVCVFVVCNINKTQQLVCDCIHVHMYTEIYSAYIHVRAGYNVTRHLSLSLSFSLILCDFIELYIVSTRIQIQIQFKIHAYIQYICISRGNGAGEGCQGGGGITFYVHILMANKCSTFSFLIFLGRIT